MPNLIFFGENLKYKFQISISAKSVRVHIEKRVVGTILEKFS